MSWLRTIRAVEYAAGIEIVGAVAEQARSVFDDVIVGNIETVLISDARKFDVIIATDVLEHLVDPWGVVKNLSKFLKPDGLFLASIPNVAHWNTAFKLFFRGRWDYQQEGLLDRTHLRFFTESTARSLFEDCGFIVEKVAYTKNYPGDTRAMRWYAQKYLRHIIPTRLVNFQFLIRARRPAESEFLSTT